MSQDSRKQALNNEKGLWHSELDRHQENSYIHNHPNAKNQKQQWVSRATFLLKSAKK